MRQLLLKSNKLKSATIFVASFGFLFTTRIAVAGEAAPAKIPCSDQVQPARIVTGYCSSKPLGPGGEPLLSITVSVPKKEVGGNCYQVSSDFSKKICRPHFQEAVNKAIEFCTPKAKASCDDIQDKRNSMRSRSCDKTPDVPCPNARVAICKEKFVDSAMINSRVCPGEEACEVPKKYVDIGEPGYFVPQFISDLIREEKENCVYRCTMALGGTIDVRAQGKKCVRCLRGCGES